MTNREFTIYVQQQSPSGNWVDVMGFQADDIKSALSQLNYYRRDTRFNFRVVRRVDEVIDGMVALRTSCNAR